MTSAAESPGLELALDIAGGEIARRHVLADRRPDPESSWARIGEAKPWLARVRAVFSEPESRAAKAAEWFLDNEYRVHRAILQIEKDLPPGFYRELPALVAVDGRYVPRVLDLARGLLEASHLQLSWWTITRFVDAYQKSTALTTAELWALPTALRLACIETLAAAVERLVPSLPAPFALPDAPNAGLDDTECIARALGNLRLITSISWKDFFCHASAVEAILTRDPSGVYSQMDFETADRYRRVVEWLARGTHLSETGVADRVVAHARHFLTTDAERAHVGYWLIGGGVEAFEASLGFRVPVRLRLRRALMRRSAGLYATALFAAVAVALVLPGIHLAALDASPGTWLLALAVTLLPASVLGVTLVHWAITQLVPPRVLPKLDLEAGIPPDLATAVVVPSLASSVDEVEELLEELEAHYLGNPESAVEFVLLTDFADARVERMPGDAAILDALDAGIRRLNQRYARAGPGPFHALHRPRRCNPSEGCWMGWERKRGKLEEFNRLVLGAGDTSFSTLGGAPDETRWVRDVRFVVTLDADTKLPQGVVRRLVGTMAHPLNRARFDDASGRVVSGYTVIQPRVEIEPVAERRSRFVHLFAGDTAIDIYSRAVSDVYQDLMGCGIYVGKGIYDVAAFARSLEGRVPENALVSHDLFEGIHGRVGLATDVVLYESFPGRYLEYAHRMHRWIRGDWQLLPWLGRRVPGPCGRSLPNRLRGIDRWKVLDNLRRSLLAPGIVAMLAVGWLVLPGHPLLWTMLGVLAPAGHVFTDLVTGFARGRRRSAVRSTLRRFSDHAGRWLLLVVFLPFEAWLAMDAIVRTLVRLTVTKRGFLQWRSAAHTASHVEAKSSRWNEWREMLAGPLVALALGGALLVLRPDALPSAALLLAAWLVSPEVAHRLGFAHEVARPALTDEDRRLLRKLARRTWLFFETFAGPEDQWLPPDNFQEEPGAVIAHRTSPTNIGMMLVSSLAAWDLGYLGTGELEWRLGNVFETLGRLGRHRGHFLNWYDTRSLDPLEPRYVSAVDSGNLAISLLAVKEGCFEIANGSPFQPQRWNGLVDTLVLLEEDLERLADGDRRERLREMLRAMEARAEATRCDATEWIATLDALAQGEGQEFENELREAIVETEGDLELSVLRDIRIWLERIHQQIRAMRGDVDTYAPWSKSWSTASAGLASLAGELAELLPLSMPLADDAVRIAKARERLGSFEPEAADAVWCEELLTRLDEGEAARAQLRDQLLDRAHRAEALVLEMEFGWLYDPRTRLFHIGYNASADQLDDHLYDLLASEARIASIVAIAKGDVPFEHWFHLGRGVTKVGSQVCLVSWGGSMFEYLMPALLMKSETGTLLAQSARAVVEAHQRFARARGLPWGVSESGFASLDAARNYRYRAFGVPGIGLRRDLGEDDVVAPYATVLALDCDRKAALENLDALIELGMVGEYGLFEAVDFTPGRVPEGRRSVIVQSYMAHHQGMVLAALGNALCEDALIRRVHADARIRSVELLLHERVPSERPPELMPRVEQRPLRVRPSITPPAPWTPVGPRGSAIHLLGNGRLSSWISDAGAGGLQWHGTALTRWTPDPTTGNEGLYFYLKDEESGDQWSAVSSSPGMQGPDTLVRFHAHRAEFHRRDFGIGLTMEVAVVPGDDVEIRRFTLVNERGRPRSLTMTSYAEVVLGDARDDARHPAFSKLFVGSEWLESQGALLFSRRPRGPDERPPVLLHRVIADAPNVHVLGYESDRRAFVGRGRDLTCPEGRIRSAPESTGFVGDPIASICVHVELEPNESVRLAFVMAAAGSRSSVLEISERYQILHALDWVVADAASDAAHRLAEIGVEGAKLPHLQQLASLLVHPRRPWRDVGTLRENRLGQPRLWGMGISGDVPILLVETADPHTNALLRDLIVGHRLWREKGLVVDLVVLRSGSSSYVEPVGEKLLGLLQELGARERLGQQGGIHFLVADQMSPEDRRLLRSVARVVLEGGGGSLADQLRDPAPSRALPPDFAPSHWNATHERTTALARARDLVFDNGFGGFAPDGREYVIHLEPGEMTPAPWSNVLANDRFGCLVTESGGGFTWQGNSGENRLSPWSNDPVSDRGGEALYLRDEETGIVWTPTPLPAGGLGAHEIRHSAGLTQFRSNDEGLAQTLRVFVPPDDPVKIVHLHLRNEWDRPRRVTATYYVEWVLGVGRSDFALHVVPDYDPVERALLVRNPWSPEFAEGVAFLASSAEPHGLTADREEFLGRGGSLRTPAALARWGLSNRVEPGGDPCGALQVHLELAPGGACEVHFVLGQGRDRAEALELVGRWRDPGVVPVALDRTQSFWDEQLEAIQVRTPDPAMDLMLNRWLLHQAIACRLLARSAFYQSGGAFGFRDQLQDALCLVHTDPGRLRSQLLECAAHQFEEGDVLHWWHPPSGRGVRTRCSDDLLWLPYATAYYVESTGDESVLQECVPFLHAPPLGDDEAERYALYSSLDDPVPLFDHCLRALDRGVTRGPHGLPLIGTGDWNDGMNRIGERGVGESVWLGWFAIAALRGFADVCDRRGETEVAERLRGSATELSHAVEEHGWDGAWYRRAWGDDGQPFGSSDSEECRIDSIAQSWSVLSGAGRPARVGEALRAADDELVREEDGLVRLLWPPFDLSLRDPGYIKAYPPGVRENGGQYTHAAAWLGLAWAELGEPERAMRVFRLIAPIGHALDRASAEHYRVEPYVIAADVASVPPHVGRGGWTWYTGAAAWTWRLGLEGILGIRRVAGGLRVEPCIPPTWGEAEIRYRTPKGVLVISIQDPDRVGRGVARIELDGKSLEAPVVPLPDDGGEHSLVVRLGR